MGLLKHLFGGGSPGAEKPHALLLRIVPGAGGPATPQHFLDLESAVRAAVDAHGVGEAKPGALAGEAWEQWVIGPDAEAIWEALMPVLEGRAFAKGSRAVKYFGAPGSSREEGVNLHWDG
jgi:hypothetical protein